MSGSFQTRDREKLWNMTLVGLRVSVDIWTWRTAVIWGLHSIRGTPKPADPFACVCLFMQGFEVVLLNASFGCIGKLFFNLAWQAYGLGFALHIPLVQHWCLRLRPLKPGVLFKTPLITEELQLLVVNQRAEFPPPPAEKHLKRGTRKEDLHSLNRSHRLLANCDETPASHVLQKNKHTHTYLHTYSNFLSCRLSFPSPLRNCPALVLLLYLYPPYLSTLPFPRPPRLTYLTFNPLIPLIQREGWFSHCC